MRIPKLLFMVGLAYSLMTGVGAAGASAKEWKTIRFGMDASYAPFESVNQKGEIVGFEVDYAKAICAKLQATCAFQNQDWDGIIPSLLANKFDVIFSSMNITDARKARVIFSDVYYATPAVFVGQASEKSTDISPAALKGKTIGTQSSTIHANFLERFYGGSEIKLYPTQDEPNLDLASGRLDYVVGDILVEQDFVKNKGNGCCKMLSQIERVPDIQGPGIGAAFRPDDTDLQAAFNKAIAELDADGTYNVLQAKYFTIDIRGK